MKIDLDLTRDELCIIQQALNLREALLINTHDFTESTINSNNLAKETALLRSKIIRLIRVHG